MIQGQSCDFGGIHNLLNTDLNPGFPIFHVSFSLVALGSQAFMKYAKLFCICYLLNKCFGKMISTSIKKRIDQQSIFLL